MNIKAVKRFFINTSFIPDHPLSQISLSNIRKLRYNSSLAAGRV
jgi:hypothetical protein